MSELVIDRKEGQTGHTEGLRLIPFWGIRAGCWRRLGSKHLLWLIRKQSLEEQLLSGEIRDKVWWVSDIFSQQSCSVFVPVHTCACVSYVSVHVCLYMWSTFTHIWLCRGQGLTSKDFSSSLKSLIDPGAHPFGWTAWPAALYTKPTLQPCVCLTKGQSNFTVKKPGKSPLRQLSNQDTSL